LFIKFSPSRRIIKANSLEYVRLDLPCSYSNVGDV